MSLAPVAGSMGAMSADADVQTAVLTRWAAVPALVAAVPVNRVFGGRVPTQDAAGVPLVKPYAQVEVTKGRDREIFGPMQAGQTFLEYRRVVIRVLSPLISSVCNFTRSARSA